METVEQVRSSACSIILDFNKVSNGWIAKITNKETGGWVKFTEKTAGTYAVRLWRMQTAQWTWQSGELWRSYATPEFDAQVDPEEDVLQHLYRIMMKCGSIGHIMIKWPVLSVLLTACDYRSD